MSTVTAQPIICACGRVSGSGSGLLWMLCSQCPDDIRHLPEEQRREIAYHFRGEPVELADENDLPDDDEELPPDDELR
jgi:hypothetical protein